MSEGRSEGVPNNIGSIVGSAVTTPKLGVEVAQNTSGPVEPGFTGHDDLKEMPIKAQVLKGNK